MDQEVVVLLAFSTLYLHLVPTFVMGDALWSLKKSGELYSFPRWQHCSRDMPLSHF
jgi:hypothetical protein